MPLWRLNRGFRMPILLLGGAEVCIFFSSIFFAATIAFGSLDEARIALGSLTPKALLISFIMLGSLVAMGLYQFNQRLYFKEAVVRVAVGFVIGSLVLAAIYYAVPSLMKSRELDRIAVLYAFFLILAVRYYFVRHVDHNIFRKRTLVVGAGERASSISDLRRVADRRGFQLVGSLSAPGDTIVDKRAILLENPDSLLELARNKNANQIVVAMDDRRGNLPIKELLECKMRGIEVIDLVEFLERETGKIRIDLVSPGWLIFSRGFRVTRIRQFNKRVMDIAFSIVAVLLAWPIMLLTAIAIKLEDGLTAPVLYKQRRVGFHGDVFNVIKFRSMRVDAEVNGEAVWATKNDDRVTRVGRCLRKLRIDELPQLFNVLRGQMSLVGPRPERPVFVDELKQSIPFYDERHSVKPGVTGWAQLKYNYGASEEDAMEKLQYDLYYVKNQSLLLDLVILLQTVEVVLWGKGAR